ncbi:MAG: class I SAM-dependent methyltransferase [Actinobacteria bacterium]|nr:class I SAM-dependent methyltransferase [Actinomycetota bacterium]MBE3114640.1 class I SAM-dependent methyltransferase [Actinomycetota bacterium]
MRNKKVLAINISCKDCKSRFILTFTESTKMRAFLEEFRKHIGHNVKIEGNKFTCGTIDRPMFIWMESEYYIPSIPLTGIEIGVNDGENAKSILESINIRKLYLIDPYSPYTEDGKLMDYTDIEKVMKKTISPYHKFTKFIKDTSENAAIKIPDNSVDFIYIDGNHSYEYVKKDIELYYPKLKSNGIMGGHDFTPETYGVAKAVIEFVEKNNITSLMAKKHSNQRDWWFIKP